MENISFQIACCLALYTIFIVVATIAIYKRLGSRPPRIVMLGTEDAIRERSRNEFKHDLNSEEGLKVKWYEEDEDLRGPGTLPQGPRKGGVNEKPTTPPPGPPTGQVQLRRDTETSRH